MKCFNTLLFVWCCLGQWGPSRLPRDARKCGKTKTGYKGTYRNFINNLFLQSFSRKQSSCWNKWIVRMWSNRWCEFSRLLSFPKWDNQTKKHVCDLFVIRYVCTPYCPALLGPIWFYLILSDPIRPHPDLFGPARIYICISEKPNPQHFHDHGPCLT